MQGDARVLFTRFARIPTVSLARSALRRAVSRHIISHRIVPCESHESPGCNAPGCNLFTVRARACTCVCASLRAPVCAWCARVLAAVECEARVCIRDGSTFLRRRDAASSPAVALDAEDRPGKGVSGRTRKLPTADNFAKGARKISTPSRYLSRTFVASGFFKFRKNEIVTYERWTFVKSRFNSRVSRGNCISLLTVG